MKKSNVTKKRIIVGVIVLIVVSGVVLVVFLLSNRQQLKGDIMLELTLLSEQQIDNVESKFAYYDESVVDYDENNFSIWFTLEDYYYDKQDSDIPYIELSGLDIDFEKEMLVISVNRKLKSFYLDENSKYEGMIEINNDGSMAPHAPYLVGVFYEPYFPGTVFIYKTNRVIYANQIPSSVYNRWNRIE